MRYAILIGLFFGFLSGLAAVGSVSAQEDAQLTAEAVAQAEEITNADLGIENPGLLPTSPFYFLKEWGRGLQSFFTFGSVRKAELHLKFANEKAAEAAKVAEEEAENAEAITRALENYERSQERLKERLTRIAETSENPNVDRLLDMLAERSVQHEQLFGHLQERWEGRKDVENAVERVRERIGEALGVAGERDVPEKFKERVKNALEAAKGSELKDIRAAEIAERLAEHAGEAAEQLEELREEFAERFREKVESEEKLREKLKDLLEEVPGDAARRSALLKELRLRASEQAADDLEEAAEHFAKRAEQKEEEEELEERMRVRDRFEGNPSSPLAVALTIGVFEEGSGRGSETEITLRASSRDGHAYRDTALALELPAGITLQKGSGSRTADVEPENPAQLSAIVRFERVGDWTLKGTAAWSASPNDWVRQAVHVCFSVSEDSISMQKGACASGAQEDSGVRESVERTEVEDEKPPSASQEDDSATTPQFVAPRERQ